MLSQHWRILGLNAFGKMRARKKRVLGADPSRYILRKPAPLRGL